MSDVMNRRKLSGTVQNRRTIHGDIRETILKGDPGDDGFSPVVEVEEIENGHRVSITDSTETHTFDVENGSKGDPGDPGQPGKDGISPTISITDITGGHRITITDAAGQHSFDVMEGGKGDPGEPGDDDSLRQSRRLPSRVVIP